MDLDQGPRSKDGSWIMKLINIKNNIYNPIYQKFLLEIDLELGPRSNDGSWIVKLIIAPASRRSASVRILT